MEIDKDFKDLYCIGVNDGKTECVIHVHKCQDTSYRFTLAWSEDGTEVFYSKGLKAARVRFEKESEFFDDVIAYGE